MQGGAEVAHGLRDDRPGEGRGQPDAIVAAEQVQVVAHPARAEPGSERQRGDEGQTGRTGDAPATAARQQRQTSRGRDGRLGGEEPEDEALPPRAV